MPARHALFQIGTAFPPGRILNKTSFSPFTAFTLGTAANPMAQNFNTITNEVRLTVLPILGPGAPPSPTTKFSG